MPTVSSIWSSISGQNSSKSDQEDDVMAELILAGAALFAAHRFWNSRKQTQEIKYVPQYPTWNQPGYEELEAEALPSGVTYAEYMRNGYHANPPDYPARKGRVMSKLFPQRKDVP